MTLQLMATRTADTATVDRPGDLLGLGDVLQTRALMDLDVRASGPDAGTFKGYACVWDVRDTYGTLFQRGSFVEGGLDQAAYALLWMHSPAVPIGTFTATEDDHGLVIAGGWDDTTEGRDARTRAKSSAPGLSVGFVPIGVDPEDDTVFTSCRLVETSQITLRMQSVPGAALTDARKVAAATAAVDLRAQADAARAMIDLAGVAL